MARVDAVLIEPCTPPHEPNYEYDLIAEQFIKLGEAVGIGAIANNPDHNSFEMPFRDFLRGSEDSPTGKEWTQPWDDMTTAYGSQYPVLIGTAGITWELPVYSDISAEYMVPYGLMTQAMFIRDNKTSMAGESGQAVLPWREQHQLQRRCGSLVREPVRRDRRSG